MVASTGKSEATVVVGVTGHRNLASEEALLAGIDLALSQIEQSFRASSLTVLSPLARGADQLVASRALTRPRSRLIVPLPLPLESYLDDFPPASRKTFMQLWDAAEERFILPSTASSEEAYVATGLYVVEHSDVLIAVWDGQPARGRGGTAEIVTRARACGLPMAWIKPWIGTGNGSQGAAASPATDEHQPTVMFEHFPSELLSKIR